MKQRWAPFQKVPSVSPPCHAKVMLLMAEIRDPMSASDKLKCFQSASQDSQQNTLSISKHGYLQLRTITIIKWRILRWIIGMYRIMVWIVCSIKWLGRNRIVMCREWMRGRQRGERMEWCGGAVGNIGVDIGGWCQWLRCCHWRCHGSGLMMTICIGVCDRLGRVFFVSVASLLSTTTKQAGEARIVLQHRMCVEMCLNDLNELLLLEFLPSLHRYHKCCDDFHKVCRKVNPRANTNETALVWLGTARRMVCFLHSVFPHQAFAFRQLFLYSWHLWT